MQKASEEAQRNERITKGANLGTFLHLGEKKTKLTSENEHALLQRQKQPRLLTETQKRDYNYIGDESVPALIFPLIESYRQKVLALSSGKEQCALIIDDFFGDAHSILKDTHLKEIARIRNEHNVEIMKLKKNTEARLQKEGLTTKQASAFFDKPKENFNAYQVKDVFADNEAERQRRLLVEENETLRKRLRAIETIANSQNLERIKFMEGASWAANKALQEANKYQQKWEGLKAEFDKRSIGCITDPTIHEVNGVEFLRLKDWTSEFLEREAGDVRMRYETLLENVNYNLSQANNALVRVK